MHAEETSICATQVSILALTLIFCTVYCSLKLHKGPLYMMNLTTQKTKCFSDKALYIFL